MRNATTKKVLELVRLAAFTVVVAVAGLGSTVFADPPDYCGEYMDVECGCGVPFCDSGGFNGSMGCSMLGCSFGADINCGTPPDNDYRTFCKNCRPCGE